MRGFFRSLFAVVLAALVLAPTSALAQATIAGVVKDPSGAALPGVSVEVASPVLIEKTRTAVTDGTGQYRIESLQPGIYSVTFTLSGFSTLKRDGVESVGRWRRQDRRGPDGRRGRRDHHSDRRLADRRRAVSTTRALTLDNETMRGLPAVRSYSYVLTTVPGLQPNITDVNTGPVFAIFPVHGGRGVESRLTIEGMNISNPPGGNQPPNYTADIGNASEVTVHDVRRPR